MAFSNLGHVSHQAGIREGKAYEAFAPAYAMASISKAFKNIAGVAMVSDLECTYLPKKPEEAKVEIDERLDHSYTGEKVGENTIDSNGAINNVLPDEEEEEVDLGEGLFGDDY